MSAWMNETATINPSVVNGNAFTHMNDPSAMMDPSAFMAGANQAQFNPQFAQQQQMLAMQQNGQMRNASPSFPNPMYQTNSVVPSKRPRQDSIASSPRQNPGMLPTSRAETPQQASFPGFQQPQQQPQQQQPPQQGGQPQYPHLQPNGSANATPSPIMANQLRPGSVPQRVSTASPHPFSPASQQFPQPSPAPSDHGGTPQPNPYIQNNTFQQGFQGTMSPARPSPSPNPMAAQMMQGMGQMPQQMGQMSNPMMAQQMQQQIQMQQMQQMQMQQMRQQLAMQQMQGMPQAQAQAQAQQQKMLYQHILQQQLQQQGNMQMATQMQGQMMAQGRSPMPKQPGQMPNGQMPPNAMRPQQPRPGANPEAFIKNLTTFMNARGKQINPSPLVDGRPIHLMILFQNVLGRGGYKGITTNNQWPAIANILGFPPNQYPMAGQQLKGHYEANLYEFENAYQANQKKMPAPPQPGGQMGAPQTPVKQQMPGQMPGPQMSPAQVQGPLPPSQTPVKAMPPGAQQASVNGFSTPQPPQAQPQLPNATPGHNRNSLSRSVEPGPRPDFPASSPAPGQKQPGISPHGPQAGPTQMVQQTARFPAPFSKDPEEYMPCSREITTVGGVDLNAFAKLGREVELYRPDVPPLDSMGTIDVAALTRSLQCGIHGEVRMALDTLATLTSTVIHGNVQQFVLQLIYCEDLLEALIDLAEEQVDNLVENTIEVSDEILITPYEDVMRACRLDKVALRDIHAFGTPEYELDQSVNRLVCITTILRNLSFTHENHKPLADEVVIKFISVVVRYLGTRNMLLRTNPNTLDLMKDLVILLSNIAHEVELPGREQALCLLQFLLAFAPGPVPTTSHDRLFFTPYDPALHPYLPPAVDALAKLLARDQPNRTFYKAIFSVDSQNSASYELLTRTFALAIAPIPDQTKDSRPGNLQPVTKAREPFLMQGLLAADIVASLAPGYESGLTRSWLSSGNGFAQNLFRLIRILSSQFEGPPQRGGRGMHRNKDDGLVYMVRLGVSMLRKLSEKARDPNDPITSIPPNVVPSRDTVFGALQMQSSDWSKEGVLKDIIAYAALEE